MKFILMFNKLKKPIPDFEAVLFPEHIEIVSMKDLVCKHDHIEYFVSGIVHFSDESRKLTLSGYFNDDPVVVNNVGLLLLHATGWRHMRFSELKFVCERLKDIRPKK